MTPIRIHFAYVPVDRPWGGANNFIRALAQQLKESGLYSFTSTIDEPSDILFMNQLTTGPGGGGTWIPFGTARRLTLGPPRRLLVARAVNLNRHAFFMGPRNLITGLRRDRQVVKLLNLADLVVFQSEYQRQFFTKHGYRGGRNVVIHNGADPAFWHADVASLPLDGPLRLASSTASPRASKNHHILARLSDTPGVEVLHCGNWPADLDPRNVRRLGMLTADRMAEMFAECHAFVHPAVKDPCPNAIFEAICSGLPVIYHGGPGSSREIVGTNGFALDEDDLTATVDRLRQELPALRASVIRERPYYSVERAARQYEKAFDGLATGLTS